MTYPLVGPSPLVINIDNFLLSIALFLTLQPASYVHNSQTTDIESHIHTHFFNSTYFLTTKTSTMDAIK